MERLHAYLYRIGAVAVFVFFLGFMVFVVIKAQSRQSGSTAISTHEVREQRLHAQEQHEVPAEPEV